MEVLFKGLMDVLETVSPLWKGSLTLGRVDGRQGFSVDMPVVSG